MAVVGNLAKIAAQLNLTNGQKIRVDLPPLILMTDDQRLPDPTEYIPQLPSGSAIVLRYRDEIKRNATAKRLVGECRAHRILMFIAGDFQLATKIGADGVHLSEIQARRQATMLAIGRARKRNPRLIITAAAHSFSALQKAQLIGADAALLSPIFPTASHPDRAHLGPTRFAGLVRKAAPMPVYALGGVNPANAARLRGSGAVGIAGVSSVISSE